MKTKGSIKGGGIYMIKNIITQDIYIGRTVNFTIRRTQHKNLCKRAKTGFLYENMKLYKPKNFVFSVLEKVEDFSLLDEKEEFWFEKLNPYYNVLGAGKNRKTREIHIQRKNKLISEAKLKRKQEKFKLKTKVKNTFRCLNCGFLGETKTNINDDLAGFVKETGIVHPSCGISIMDSKYLKEREEKQKSKSN